MFIGPRKNKEDDVEVATVVFRLTAVFQEDALSQKSISLKLNSLSSVTNS